MIVTSALNAWLYGCVGIVAGLLLGLIRRWLLLPSGRRLKPHLESIRLSRLDVLLAVTTGAGFAASWAEYGTSPQTVIMSTYFGIFLLILVLDITHRWIPNVLLLPAAVLALVISVLTGHPPLDKALLGGTAGFLWFYLMAVAYRGALGAGDVKLAGLIGLMTGFPGVFVALTIGIVIGGVTAALLLVFGWKTPKSYIPYAPFLVAGALVTLVFGTQILSQFARLSGW